MGDGGQDIGATPSPKRPNFFRRFAFSIYTFVGSAGATR